MGTLVRLAFLGIWLYLTVGPIYRALEAGQPKDAVVPALFLLVGVWAVLKRTRKKQEAEYESTSESEPWEEQAWHQEEPTDGPWVSKGDHPSNGGWSD